ncbi:hypothetical protein D9M69_613580 [compost metagenome]
MAIDLLHGIGFHRDRHLRRGAEHADGDEQPGPPRHARIGQRHACLGGAGLFAQQRADVGDLALGLGLRGGGADPDGLAHAHLVEVPR